MKHATAVVIILFATLAVAQEKANTVKELVKDFHLEQQAIERCRVHSSDFLANQSRPTLDELTDLQLEMSRCRDIDKQRRGSIRPHPRLT